MNSSKQVAVYDNTVTARTFVGYIAEQAGGFATIGRDGKLYIKTIGEDTAELDLRYFSEYSWGERFKVSRIAYEDGVQNFKKGDEINNTIWISSDNMYIVDQEQIDNIYNKYKDFEVYSFSGTSIVDPAWDIGDIITIDNKKVIYQGELEYKGKFKASITSDIQAKTKEETTATKISDKAKIRRVQSQIDQVNGTITQLAQETSEYEEKLTQVEQDVDNIKQTVEDNLTLTSEKKQTSSLTLDNTVDGLYYLLNMSIYGNMNFLYPDINLYPADDLYPLGEFFTLVFSDKSRGIESENAIEYKITLDEPLRYYDENLYDEIEYEDGVLSLIRRLGVISNLVDNLKNESGSIRNSGTLIGQEYSYESCIRTDYFDVSNISEINIGWNDTSYYQLFGVFLYDEDYNYLRYVTNTSINVDDATYVRIVLRTISGDEADIVTDAGIYAVLYGYTLDDIGNIYQLDNEIKTVLLNNYFPTFEDTTYIWVKEYNNLYFYASWIHQNEYSDAYATRVELSSVISQAADEINLVVNKTLENYVTTTEMNSAILQTANEINLTVSKKVGTDEIISCINQSAESITINANKIGLTANDVLDIIAENTINLTSKNITMSADNLNIDSSGNITLGGSEEAPAFIVTDETNECYISPLGLMSEYNLEGTWAAVQKGSIGVGIKDSNSVTQTLSISSDLIYLTANGSTQITSSYIKAPTITQTSLEKVKKNIKLFTNTALDIVEKSEIYSYNLKFENDTDKKHIGFVIGDGYQTPEEIINKSADGIDLYSMCAVLWKAIQEILEELKG